jgi:ornithine cyclodeaminase/alanine dehydrogenase-like protein (mu-crystallin family)
MDACIDAVEAAFRARGEGRPATSAVAALDLDGGALHAKLGRLDGSRRYAVAKINANFPDNFRNSGLPTIQGVVVLFDASCGKVLALLDSGSLTAVRTAAASAVAARHLAATDASTAAFVGCGIQARAHIEALLHVRPIQRITLFDIDRGASDHLAADVRSELHLSVKVASDVESAVAGSAIIVTTTPSRQPFLKAGHVGPGTFIAAVGADSETKHEIHPELMRAAIVVVDDLAQCSRFGDLHHALSAGMITTRDIRGSLDQIVAGQVPGRATGDETIVFDSTGVAIEDVAAAALAFEQAEKMSAGILVT